MREDSDTVHYIHDLIGDGHDNNILDQLCVE
jgi:hypothetical protein